MLISAVTLAQRRGEAACAGHRRRRHRWLMMTFHREAERRKSNSSGQSIKMSSFEIV